MKRKTKIVIGLAVFVHLVPAAWFWVDYRLSRRYDVAVQTVPVPKDAASLAQGEHLVKAVAICTNCHGADLGGQVQVDNAVVGRLAAPNITPGEGSVVSNYTHQDWFRAIRHAVGPDGRALLLMPADGYRGLSAEDVAMMIGWLETVPRVNRCVEKSSLGPLMRVRYLFGGLQGVLAAESFDHAAVSSAAPGAVSPGERLAITCTGCHGANFTGGPMASAPPGTPEPANLTQDATGLQGWTAGDFDRAVRQHTSKSGRQLHEFMPRMYANLTDFEVKALWSYLTALEPKAKGQR